MATGEEGRAEVGFNERRSVSSMVGQILRGVAVSTLFLMAAHTALAETPPAPRARESDADAIKGALLAWAAAFNAGNKDAVCRIFAPDLSFDFGKIQNGTYTDLCEQLRRVLGEADAHYRYELGLKEILISGDLAVVRLEWRLTITRPEWAQPALDIEHAIDVLRHEPDGTWRIFRFLGYSLTQPGRQQ